jgi:hypothetical protein
MGPSAFPKRRSEFRPARSLWTLLLVHAGKQRGTRVYSSDMILMSYLPGGFLTLLLYVNEITV